MRAVQTSMPLKCGVRTESSFTNWPRRSYASHWAFRDDAISLWGRVCVCFRNLLPFHFNIDQRVLTEERYQHFLVTMETRETHTYTEHWRDQCTVWLMTVDDGYLDQFVSGRRAPVCDSGSCDHSDSDIIRQFHTDNSNKHQLVRCDHCHTTGMSALFLWTE